MWELPPLPDGWEYRLDSNTQKFYFIDHNTQSTQWSHPVTEKVYMPSNDAGAFLECPRVQNEFNSNQQKEDDSLDIAKVTNVLKKARLLQPAIENFAGSSNDKEYTRLMETLEQAILELDTVDPQGNERVRSTRRAAVLEIQDSMRQLDTVCQPRSQEQHYQKEPAANDQPGDITSTTTNSCNDNGAQPSTGGCASPNST